MKIKINNKSKVEVDKTAMQKLMYNKILKKKQINNKKILTDDIRLLKILIISKFNILNHNFKIF